MDYSQHKQIEFRRRFWTIVGAKITLIDPASNTSIGFIKMKAWKLKEDIRLYRDESMQAEVFRIHARSIIDFGATYDVVDSKTNQPLFAWKRKGLKSAFVRDHWDLLDNQGNIIGAIQETSKGLAVARRWMGVIPFIGEFLDLAFAFVPQSYEISLNQPTGPAVVGKVLHRKNPFIVKMALDTSMAATPPNPLVTLSATSLLSIMDAVKNN
jgi:hypothetical protein